MEQHLIDATLRVVTSPVESTAALAVAFMASVDHLEEQKGNENATVAELLGHVREVYAELTK